MHSQHSPQNEQCLQQNLLARDLQGVQNAVADSRSICGQQYKRIHETHSRKQKKEKINHHLEFEKARVRKAVNDKSQKPLHFHKGLRDFRANERLGANRRRTRDFLEIFEKAKPRNAVEGTAPDGQRKAVQKIPSVSEKTIERKFVIRCNEHSEMALLSQLLVSGDNRVVKRIQK
jgi:hypothetical protein